MADTSRIEDLRRRVQKDPGSIAFAQLAEECRRAGECQEAVEICRAGLAVHSGYLSARVTLGRSLLELNELEAAQTEFEYVLKSAAENLAAIRGLAETYHRRGKLPEALAQYRTALLLARNDPDLEQTVQQLAYEVEPPLEAIEEALPIEPMQRDPEQPLADEPVPTFAIAPASRPPAAAPPIDLDAFMASAFADTAQAPGSAAAPASFFQDAVLTFDWPVVVAESEPGLAAPASMFDAPAKTIAPEGVAAESATTFALPSIADEPVEPFQPAIVVAESEPTFSTTTATVEEALKTFAPALVVSESEGTFAAPLPIAAETAATFLAPLLIAAEAAQPFAPLPDAAAEPEPVVVSAPRPVAVEPAPTSAMSPPVAVPPLIRPAPIAALPLVAAMPPLAFALSAHEVALPDDLTAAPDSPHDSERARANRIVLALEQFLAAVHVPRAVRRA